MPDLRVTAGTLRGRRIPLPPDARPTSERARQAFFNIIGDRIRGALFLDLFAGSGIFAFEAVSRGARRAVAIESDRRKAGVIERLASQWNAPVESISDDVPRALPRLTDVFDVVYADPPYESGAQNALLGSIDQKLPLSEDAIVAIEHRRKTSPFDTVLTRLQLLRRAEYGEVWISFFTPQKPLPHPLQDPEKEA